MGRHRRAAVVGRDRLGPRGRVAAQVLQGDRAPRGRQGAGLVLGRLTRVELVPAQVGHALQGRGEGRQADPLAGTPWTAVGPVDAEPGRVRAERVAADRRGPLDGLDEAAPRGEAIARQLDRGGQQGRPREPAEPVMRVAPGAHRPGHGDRQGAPQRHLSEPSPDQRAGVRGRRRAARPVQADLLAGARVPDQPERVAADAAGAAEDDRQGGVRGDGRVDRRAARPQDVAADRGGQVMGCHDRPVQAVGGRHGHLGSGGHLSGIHHGVS